MRLIRKLKAEESWWGPAFFGFLTWGVVIIFTNEQVGLQRNNNCPVCGEYPTITEPVDYEQPKCEDCKGG